MAQNKSRYAIPFFIIISLFLAPAISAVPTTYWICSYGNAPYGDISITYVNDNAANKAEIASITTQKYPILYPGERVVIIVSSKNCAEFTLAIKDSNGNEVDRFSEEPFSPAACDVEIKYPYGFYLTKFDFNTSKTPGIYTLDLFDDNGFLLTTGVISTLDSSTVVSSLTRKSWCTMDGSEYEVTLRAPYPIPIGGENVGMVGVTIKGPDVSTINEMFSKISATTGTYSTEKRLNNTGDPICVANECNQGYYVTSGTTEYTVLRVMQEVTDPTPQYNAINSETVSVLDLNEIKSIRSRLGNISSLISKYTEYYTSTGETEKVALCQNIFNGLGSLSDKLDISIAALDKGTLTASEAHDLIDFVETSQTDMDYIIDSVNSLRTQ